MNNFTFYGCTKFVFGKDTEKQAGALVKEFGGSRVLLHFGGGSVVKSGLHTVLESLMTIITLPKLMIFLNY